MLGEWLQGLKEIMQGKCLIVPGPGKALSRQPLVLVLAIMVASETPPCSLLVKSSCWSQMTWA